MTWHTQKAKESEKDGPLLLLTPNNAKTDTANKRADRYMPYSSAPYSGHRRVKQSHLKT